MLASRRTTLIGCSWMNDTARWSHNGIDTLEDYHLGRSSVEEDDPRYQCWSRRTTWIGCTGWKAGGEHNGGALESPIPDRLNSWRLI
jgi:hypothetical protein